MRLIACTYRVKSLINQALQIILRIPTSHKFGFDVFQLSDQDFDGVSAHELLICMINWLIHLTVCCNAMAVSIAFERDHLHQLFEFLNVWLMATLVFRRRQ